ncbi:class I SAM-dependent methyltransferase [Methylophilaceae bacterium]|nr:class I SAM-dependent methyltransferase [Methylophilaceae bacterium]
MNKIYETLKSINVTSKETRKVLAENTRDKSGVLVWRDEQSKVIYIEDTHYNTHDYSAGGYRQGKTKSNYESDKDLKRREKSYRQFYMGLDICDVGCGSGGFLLNVKHNTLSASAVELQTQYVELLNANDIKCFDNIQKHKMLFHTIFAFHSLEHFEDPLSMLKDMKGKLRKGGRVVIEVPHAKDFLISALDFKPFIDFTLWSPHLVLHTRESLNRLLIKAGFKSIMIEGIQRYPLSNHIQWLLNSKPGGHMEGLSIIDSIELNESYQNAMRKIDATDTLIAIGEL